MPSTSYLCICIYCILQLGFLLKTNIVRNRTYSIKEHYFTLMLCIALLSFIADVSSSMNHWKRWFYPFAKGGTYLEIILNTFLLPIYFMYVCKQISDMNLKLQKRMHSLLLLMACVCSGIVVSTFGTGKIFYYSVDRNYHRGSWFWLPMSILLVMMIMIEVFIMSQKNKIEMNFFRSLFIFQLLPLIGWTLQSFVYGLPFSLISITFAALVIYINVQNRSIDLDYLTGVFNRQSLDAHMQEKILKAQKGKTFSAMLIDIDCFKKINDTYGHNEGDLALIHATEILRQAVRYKDFIARYGGDEFCIIFDEQNIEFLDKMKHSIESHVDEFNEKLSKPYQLSFSIGFAVFDKKNIVTREDFFVQVDQKMYEAKRNR